MHALSSTTRRVDKLESDCGTLYFNEPGVEVTLSTADGALLLIPALDLRIWTSAKATTLRMTVMLLIAEAAKFIRAINHELSDEERKRKDLLFDLIDVVRSGVLHHWSSPWFAWRVAEAGVLDQWTSPWFAGWVAEEGEITVFHPMDESDLKHSYGLALLAVPKTVLTQLVLQGWSPNASRGNFCLIQAQITSYPPTIIQVEYAGLKFPE